MTNVALNSLNLDFVMAERLIRDSGCRASYSDMANLAADIVAVRDERGEPHSGNTEQSVQVLEERIGGLRNLRSYLDCLAAGRRREPQPPPPLSDGFFRKLDAAETAKFQKWARDHYKPGAPLDEMWHPVVRAECQRMNDEPMF